MSTLIIYGCDNKDSKIKAKENLEEKFSTNPTKTIVKEEEEAITKYNNGDFSCFFFFENELTNGFYKNFEEKSELLLKLGVCNFFNTEEKHFVLSNQYKNYDNYTFAYNYFSQIEKPIKNTIINKDGVESQIFYYEMARYYMALSHYYGNMGLILNDHQKALELLREIEFKNDNQSNYIKTHVYFTKSSKKSVNPYILFGSPLKYIANIYIMDLAVEPDENKFEHYMKQAADDDKFIDSEASYLLGMYYFSIKNRKKIYGTLAKKYIKKSHEQGYLKAKEFWDKNEMYKMK